MILLLGWSKPLRPEIVDAIISGQIKIIHINDKKYGEYELLQGEVKIDNTVIAFK